ncbi:Bug family tripartite tricarboxylate transporter substrate binding protein [Sabulicella glaciei]|uniref:Tripartite tricarboxylate transporter substrate binding protein n=1 Tax=Sabulicella glaciei TaxID=2984948 RepID=A0ABT3P025_9PROT|nr:tripartite tricarboxylate transporter substrate binding protein [Roseococcus sp. MDT2-1-1]MCW8087762.1 tripartite tricarboxylate transporter substrate binding protein [Roseococcus sp. MDT2-1-1]
MTTRRAALGLLATPLLLPEARAQSWPSRPLRLVVPYAPGGTTDQLGRSLAELLSRELGQPVVVENRPGGNTVIGTQAVAQAAPDGHTLLMASGASMILNPLVMRRIPYDAERDLSLLSVTVETPLVMVVGPQVQARNVAEFTALAKQRPMNVASVGIGNPIHLAAELYALSAGVELQNIVYPGSAPALTALLSGDVQVMFDVVLTSLPFIRDNKLRALAVTTRERLAVLPEVPTLAESGYPGYEASTWFGVAAPAGLPAPVEARLREALAAAQRDAGFRQRFDSLGLVVQPPRDAAAIATMLRAERERWSGVVQRRGISLE